MPSFDKQAGHCLRISTEVVKWPEQGDEWRVIDTVAHMQDMQDVLGPQTQFCSLRVKSLV